jgi:hypothetical protein
MGQQVIGAPGGQWWLSSPELLKDGLKRWRADVIDLYLDGEDPQKPRPGDDYDSGSESARSTDNRTRSG